MAPFPIRLARPSLGPEELSAVAEVLASGQLVLGPKVAAFEAALAEATGRPKGGALAVSSGTSALVLALMALKVDGGEVLCPDLSWPSPAHAIRLAGARPVLVDVDPREWNARPEALAAARTGRTRAAILIDQFGTPARTAEAIEALPGLPVIGDSACAIGSERGGRPAASFAHIACLSFHPRKVLTTGEGGACLSDDPVLIERMAILRNHGQRRVEGPRGAEVEFVEAGHNFRMGELEAAIGLAQLARLPSLVARRRALAARYREALSSHPRTAALAFQEAPPGALGNAQTFGCLLPEGTSPARRDAWLAALRERGVEAGRLSYALHRLPSLEGARVHGGEVAEAIEDRGLALPLHADLEDADQARVIEALTELPW